MDSAPGTPPSRHVGRAARAKAPIGNRSHGMAMASPAVHVGTPRGPSCLLGPAGVARAPIAPVAALARHARAVSLQHWVGCDNEPHSPESADPRNPPRRSIDGANHANLDALGTRATAHCCQWSNDTPAKRRAVGCLHCEEPKKKAWGSTGHEGGCAQPVCRGWTTSSLRLELTGRFRSKRMPMRGKSGGCRGAAANDWDTALTEPSLSITQGDKEMSPSLVAATAINVLRSSRQSNLALCIPAKIGSRQKSFYKH